MRADLPAFSTNQKKHFMSAKNLKIQKMTPTIGEEISGIDLMETVSDELLEAVYEALIEHQVIFSGISRSPPQAIRPFLNHSENPNLRIPFILIWKVMKTLFSSPTVPTILPTPTAGTQTSHSGRTLHIQAS